MPNYDICIHIMSVCVCNIFIYSTEFFQSVKINEKKRNVYQWHDGSTYRWYNDKKNIWMDDIGDDNFFFGHV